MEHTKNTIDNVITALRKKEVLPATNVTPAVAVYDNNTASVILALKTIERDVVQNVYSRLRITDTFLNQFEKRFIVALKEHIVKNPWAEYEGLLSNLRDNCNVTQELIKSLFDKNLLIYMAENMWFQLRIETSKVLSHPKFFVNNEMPNQLPNKPHNRLRPQYELAPIHYTVLEKCLKQVLSTVKKESSAR